MSGEVWKRLQVLVSGPWSVTGYTSSGPVVGGLGRVYWRDSRRQRPRAIKLHGERARRHKTHQRVSLFAYICSQNDDIGVRA